jgi:hypothetical protein
VASESSHVHDSGVKAHPTPAHSEVTSRAVRVTPIPFCKAKTERHLVNREGPSSEISASQRNNPPDARSRSHQIGRRELLSVSKQPVDQAEKFFLALTLEEPREAGASCASNGSRSPGTTLSVPAHAI